MTTFTRTFGRTLFFPIALLGAVAASFPGRLAAAEDLDGRRFNLDHGVILHGYDPLSYFVDKSPAVGKPELKFSTGGATYLFASQEHLDAFKREPQKYEPQYGGWCAYAMASGDFVDIDPKSYKIKDGKLFLFYNGFWGDTLQKWNKDEGVLYPKAQEKWTSFLKTSGEAK